MDTEDKSSLKQHTRKRSLSGPQEPREKRRAGNAAATENAVVAVSVHPPPGTAAWRVSRQLGDGQPDGIASSSASDVMSSAAGPAPAISAAMVHVCGHCQKRFRSPGKLAQHERVHTTASDAAFYCSYCPKQFGKQGEATRHERTHTGEKPYACSMCPRRFGQKSAVVPHERTHTGEKPYACSMCPRRFTQKNKVAPHERTHTGEKPYACSICAIRFAEKSSAVRHKRAHTAD